MEMDEERKARLKEIVLPHSSVALETEEERRAKNRDAFDLDLIWILFGLRMEFKKKIIKG